MVELFRSLYEKLVSGIKEIEQSDPAPKKQIESCFHLSESIRMRVDQMITGREFTSEAEEINFFKNTKPLFTAPVEYYSILYRAELFIPEAASEQAGFWADELQRARIFLSRHTAFLDYMKSGETTRDREYFMRDGIHRTSSGRDELIAKLHARERYIEYIEGRLDGEGLLPANP